MGSVSLTQRMSVPNLLDPASFPSILDVTKQKNIEETAYRNVVNDSLIRGLKRNSHMLDTMIKQDKDNEL